MKVRVIKDVVDEYFIVQYKRYFWSVWMDKKYFRYDPSDSCQNYDSEPVVKEIAIRLANQILQKEVIYETT